MSATLFLADDHPIVLKGLRSLLEPHPELRIVGEAVDGLAAVEGCERLRPDVLVLDLVMPRLHGLEAMRQIRQRSPRTRILVLSFYVNEAYVFRAMQHGALGYLNKRSIPEELVGAVRSVAAGRRYLSAPLTARKIAEFEARMRAGGPADPYETLTNREREVLQMAAEGLSNAEMAARLCIGVRTVETHRSRALRKLDIRTHADLVRYAIRRGLLQVDE